jgi:hypoxanthine phosphoribosyltransferase
MDEIKKQDKNKKMIDFGWEDIRDRLKEIELPAVELVVGIASGGTVPAALTAQKLGVELKLININYRDEENNPQHSKPVLLEDFYIDEDIRSILLVDDVSVTGKTLETVKEILGDYDIKTFVFKGKADYVLFPEIKYCVNWPWNTRNK